MQAQGWQRNLPAWGSMPVKIKDVGDSEAPLRDMQLYVLLGRLSVRLEATYTKIQLGKSTAAQLEGVTDAVEAIHDCLKSIPTFEKTHLVALAILSAALGDVQTGKKPKLFQTTGEVGKRPTAYEDFLRTKTVCCIAVLKAAGMRVGDAHKMVSDLWHSLGIRQVSGESERKVKISTIVGWEGWARRLPRGSIERKMVQSAAASARSHQQASEYVHETGLELALWATSKDKVAPK